MNRLLGSAAYRIAFTYSAAFALAILLLGTAVFYAADAHFRDQQDISLAEENAALVREYGEGGMPDLVDAIARREAGKLAHGYEYAVFDRACRKIAGRLSAPCLDPGLQDIALPDSIEGPELVRGLVARLPNGGRMITVIDTEAVEQADATILALFGGAFVLVILMGIIGAFILGGYLRNRLSRIGGTAQAIIAGDLGRRVPVSVRDDEFDQLASALNSMLDRIAQLLDNLRQVSSDVAHDLRTPLARMRGQIESALDDNTDPDAHRQALKRALVQSDDLLALFAAILRISEVESGALKQHFASVDLSHLATDLCESYGPAVNDGGRHLDAAIAPGLLINGDRELIAQAVINLLDNAQRHTPRGTHIVLGMEAAGASVLVSVADDGPGVPAQDRALITRRFTRLEASRTTPGHGLGLNLVSAIIAMHGGTVAIDDQQPGLRVTLTLPRLGI